MTITIPDMLIILPVAAVLVSGTMLAVVPIGESNMPVLGKIFVLLMMLAGAMSLMALVTEAVR